MQTKLWLRVLYFSESPSEFLILLENNGDFPMIDLDCSKSIEDQLLNKLTSIFNDNSIAFDIINTKQISSIETSDGSLNITYNFISPTQHNKGSGKFVKFNQKSIEIFRYMNENPK